MSFVYEYGRVQSQFSKGIMLVSLNGVNDCTTMARMQSTETVAMRANADLTGTS